MKHKYQKILFLILFSWFLASCNRDNSEIAADTKKSFVKTLEDLFIGYDKPSDGELIFTNQNTASSIYGPKSEYFAVTGSMFVNRNPDNFFNAGKIFVNGFELPFNPNQSGGSYGFVGNINSSEGRFLKDLWGKKIGIKIAANNDYRFIEQDSGTYIPMAIEMQASFVNTKVVSTSQSQSITWEPDPNNPTGKVFLFGVYEGPDSKEVNSSFSDTTEIKFQKELADNGSHTLAPYELGTGFPVGSRMSFYLARGNYQVITTNEGTEVTLQAIAYSSSNILAVKQ